MKTVLNRSVLFKLFLVSWFLLSPVLTPISQQSGMGYGADTVHAASYYTYGDRTESFSQSGTRSRTRTVTIPDIYDVNSIRAEYKDSSGNWRTHSNVTASYDITGDKLTINVENRGSTSQYADRDSYYDSRKYRKSASDHRESSSNSFPSSVNYSSNGYSGRLSKSGSSSVKSGSAADSRTETDSKSGHDRTHLACRGSTDEDGNFSGKMRTKNTSYNGTPSSVSYNSGGYSGTLRETRTKSSSFGSNVSGDSCGDPSRTHTYGETWTTYYSGTVSKPDTRVWEQDYSGTIYKGGTSYRNYEYAYRVFIDYERNVDPIMNLQSGLDKQRVADFEGFNYINVDGNIYDQDEDNANRAPSNSHFDVNIKAEILGTGYSKTKTVREPTSSEAFNINFDLFNMNIENGEYTVKVTASDGRGGTDTGSFNIKIRDSLFDNQHVLIDDFVQFLYTVEDIENDKIIKEQFIFGHDPKHFEYSDRAIGDERVERVEPYEQRYKGIIPEDNQWLDEPFDSFNRVGHYEIQGKAQDEPKPDPNFEEFNYFSNNTPSMNIYVHRKPVADIEAYVNYQNEVMVIDRSLDWDRYSKGQRGIEVKDFYYKRESSSTWLSGKPDTLDHNRDWEIRVDVEDFQGEPNTDTAKVEVVGTFPNVPPMADFIYCRSFPTTSGDCEDEPFYVGDTMSVKSRAFDDDLDPLDVTYEVIDPNGDVIESKEYRGLFDYSKASFEFDVPEIAGEYQIVQTVDDGNFSNCGTCEMRQTFDVEELSISGNVGHTDKWKAVHEKMDNPSDVFYSGEKFLVDSVVTDHLIDNVTVTLNGEQLTGNMLTIKKDMLSSHPNYYNEIYDYTMSDPEQRLKYEDVTFTFEATWENGVIRSDVVTVEVIDSAINVYDLHRTK
ncbi:hypothetical protein H0266_18310 [Halobacillus locisalis]|uniref:Uncharacterized protein n=1 Tax=Halobacillus locisalis TaxID=220753 RepID=A0A838CZU1_9BACI|nr:hypothetical protein [Halobacillus locisalis]MBA2176836.1 hypothetical protein [Halobacillus locisalis]